MGFWGWVGAIATGWFVASVLFAVMWALGMKRIFRKPPAPPTVSNVRRIDGEEGDAAAANGSDW